MSEAINIFHFNPTCELAVANGSPYYQPPAVLKEFEENLSCLMLWFAKKEDIVINNTSINKHTLESFDLIQLNTNSLQTKKHAIKKISHAHAGIKPMPWGWSPAAEYFLNDFNPSADAGHKDYIKHYERKNSIHVLTEIVTELNSPFLVSKENLPVAVYSEREIETRLQKWQKLVLKAPLSSSGRGLQIIRKNKLDNSKKQWINTILNQQNYIVCEPLLEKTTDLSFQFKLDSRKQLKFLGVSYFKTNNNGQYQGHFLNLKPKMLDEFEKLASNDFFNFLAQKILQKFNQDVFMEYEGYIGVDAFLYFEDNKLKLQPCVEINPRFNMGLLSMRIQEKICSDSTGCFMIYNGKDYSEFVKSSTKKNPPIFTDGKFKSGFMSLTGSKPRQRFGAYINLNAAE